MSASAATCRQGRRRGLTGRAGPGPCLAWARWRGAGAGVLVRALGLAAIAALVGPGCASAEPGAAPPDLPLVEMQPSVRLELVEQPPGPAPVVWARLIVEPSDGQPFTLAPSGPRGEGPPPRAILELHVRWQDHSGDEPIARGHSGQTVLEWSDSKTAEPGRPAVVAARLELGPVQGARARRVEVRGRLIGVELRREDARSGGIVLDLPLAHLDSLAPAPEGTLDAHLESGSVEGIFLAAAGSPPEARDATLDRLIEALPASEEPARQAILAALLYLTGETHGRDAQSWRTWWNEQRQQARP